MYLKKTNYPHINELLKNYRLLASINELASEFPELRADKELKHSETLKLIDAAAHSMRISDKDGEKLYWVLHFTYFVTPAKVDRSQILEEVSAQLGVNISKSTYHELLGKALSIMERLLPPADFPFIEEL